MVTADFLSGGELAFILGHLDFVALPEVLGKGVDASFSEGRRLATGGARELRALFLSQFLEAFATERVDALQ